MRLLNAKTITLEVFNETNTPPYAILSHTWGSDEVTFQEIEAYSPRPTSKAGYQKIVKSCHQALRDGFSHIWVDTCCIDKTSSAELSEAINSMFRWYEDASTCYAYLSDVPNKYQAITSSRWFTRGWTLQELIAPSRLVFFASDWQPINARGRLSKLISEATGIDGSFLRDGRGKVGPLLRSASIAQRMSWAAGRQTTRAEDLAYCLLGIFDISMPLLYGEGNKAFIRLQEEIIRHTDDQSIFAWNFPSLSDDPARVHLQGDVGVLAPSPAAFADSGEIEPVDTGEQSSPFSLTNHGIRIDLRVFRDKKSGAAYGVLHCRKGNAANLLAIPLHEQPGSRFERESDLPTKWVDYQQWYRAPKIPVYLLTELVSKKHQIPQGCYLVKDLPEGVSVAEVSRGYTWSPGTSLITMDKNKFDFGGRDVLHVNMQLDPTKDSPCDLVTVSITVRRLFTYGRGPRWVTYDVRYSKAGHAIQANNGPVGPLFPKVQKQAVFGQEIIVIEVLQWGNESEMFKRLLWAQMRLNMLLSRHFFDALDKTGAWPLIECWEAILEFGLIRPAVVIALWLVLWPPPISQLLNFFGSAERMATSVFSPLRLDSAKDHAVYLLASWFGLPSTHFSKSSMGILIWIVLWLLRPTSLKKIMFWVFIFGVWGEPLAERYRKSSWYWYGGSDYYGYGGYGGYGFYGGYGGWGGWGGYGGNGGAGFSVSRYFW
ncbi:hypothetical protein ACJ41O_007440 [Fusarium nematophilum]